jgi:hypothetical protein
VADAHLRRPSLSLIAGSVAARSDAAAVAGLLGFTLAPSIVHFTQGNPTSGAMSIAARVLLPLAAGGAAALAAGSGTSDKGTLVASGALAGALGAIAIDTAFLAFTKGRAPTQDAPRTALRITASGVDGTF